MYGELESNNHPSHVLLVNDMLDMLKRPGSICFIFEKDNEAVGFSILYPDNKGGCVGESLFIKEQWRGTKLFFNILTYLKGYVNANYKYCNLIASNTTISKLYSKIGYNVKYVVYQYEVGHHG